MTALDSSPDCGQCGKCVKVCAVGNIRIDGGGPIRLSSSCLKCGQCVAVCPHQKIRLFEDDYERPPPTCQLTQTAHVVQMRRSVRSFIPDVTVPEGKVRDLLTECKYAPSTKNRRQVQFVVFQRSVLIDLIPAVHKYYEAPNEHPYTAEWVRLKAVNREPLFCGAPHAVIAIGLPEDEEDGLVALTTFELLAHNSQIGTCWNGFLKNALNDCVETKEIIGLSGELRVLGAINFGYTAVQYARPAARRNLVENQDYCFVE